jgi:hypothetical protein
MFGTVQAQTSSTASTVQSYKYKVTATWSSTDSSLSTPQNILDYQHTDYIEVRVDSTNVAYGTEDTLVAQFFNNGSGPIANSGTTNLNSGETQGGFAKLISPGLTQGQVIHTSASDGITINSTATRTYQSGTRATNEISLSGTNQTTGETATSDRFFDQQTGVLVQEIDTYTSSTSSSNITWQITESTAWAIPEFPALIVLPVLFIAATLAIIASKKRLLFPTKA